MSFYVSGLYINSKLSFIGPLRFAVDTWKLTILIPETSLFPTTLTVTYETLPKLGSLMWYESDGKCFAFTGGCTIGNRGLLPCQDAPKCLSTYPLPSHLFLYFNLFMTFDFVSHIRPLYVFLKACHV